MAYQVLTPEQVEQFVDRGWVRLEQAIPRDIALAAQDVVWRHVEKRGVLKHDPDTWTVPMVHLKEGYTDPEFQRCNTARLTGAVEDLVGPGRLLRRVVYGETEDTLPYGWWPVNFSVGAESPWDVPTEGWHWDGIQFRHYVDSPDQGLLCLCVFSDIGPRGGATLVAEGSHKLVARFLAGQPDGIEIGDAIRQVNRSHPWLAELTGAAEEPDPGVSPPDRIERFMGRTCEDGEGNRLRVVETTARAGDVYLCHPFLYHAASQNHLRVPRFMCNRTMPLRDRLQLRRADKSGESPLERSIRLAIE